MRPAKTVKIGDQYLENMSIEELMQIQATEKDYKVKTKIQAAILGKKNNTLDEISKAIGKSMIRLAEET